MAETTTTALDVAVEYVALKLALVGALDTITGTEPNDISEAMSEWAQRSPVSFPMGDEDPADLANEFCDKLYGRADVIEEEVLAAVGAFLTAKAERLRKLRGTEVVA